MGQREDGRELWDGGRLKEIRKARGLSQEVVGEQASIGTAEISRHELNTEKSNPTIAVLARLARALNVPLFHIFEPVGTPIPRPEEEPGRATASLGGASAFADALRREVAEYERSGAIPEGWSKDVLVAIFALTRALARPETLADAPEPTPPNDRRAARAPRSRRLRP